MKCKIFSGKWYDVQDEFNEWAKGKALTKDVIVHTHTAVPPKGAYVNSDYLLIIIFYPEGSQFDTET